MFAGRIELHAAPNMGVLLHIRLSQISAARSCCRMHMNWQWTCADSQAAGTRGAARHDHPVRLPEHAMSLLARLYHYLYVCALCVPLTLAPDRRQQHARRKHAPTQTCPAGRGPWQTEERHQVGAQRPVL